MQYSKASGILEIQKLYMELLNFLHVIAKYTDDIAMQNVSFFCSLWDRFNVIET